MARRPVGVALSQCVIGTSRGANEGHSDAFVGLAQHGLDRAFLGRSEIHALAGAITVLAAERLGRRDAVGRPVRGVGTALASVHQARGRQLGDGVHGILGGVGRALTDLGRIVGEALAVGGRVVVEVVHLPLGAAQMVAEVAGALIEPAADRFEHAGLFRRRHRAVSGAAAGGGGAASWAKANGAGSISQPETRQAAAAAMRRGRGSIRVRELLMAKPANAPMRWRN